MVPPDGPSADHGIPGVAVEIAERDHSDDQPNIVRGLIPVVFIQIPRHVRIGMAVGFRHVLGV